MDNLYKRVITRVLDIPTGHQVATTRRGNVNETQYIAMNIEGPGNHAGARDVIMSD